jgi:glycosyltransferase involved in cell wall biosynthesis
MRIAQVSHELPPYELAGTAIYTLNVAKAQAAAGHDVTVFARLQDPSVEPYRVHDERRDGLTVRFVNKADLEWSPLERSYRDDRMDAIFGAFLDEFRPEIVHFQHIVGLGAGCIEAAAARRIRTLMTLHDFWTMCPMGQRVCYTDFQICDPIRFEKCGPCVFGAGWEHPPEPSGASASGRGGAAARFDAFYRERVASTPGLFARRPRALLWAADKTVRSYAAEVFGEDESNGARPARTSTNPFAIRSEALRRTLDRVDLLITPSAFLRQQFIEHFDVRPERIIHSSNGMDLSYVERLPKAKGQRLRFGFVGSIIRTKGVHVLVDAFLRAVTGRVDIELHVFGAPNRWTKDYFDELVEKTRHCPFVTFHGRFDNKDISRVLSTIDVLVLPSIWFENAPLTLNEAAISGTPILVSDRGGMLEFVECNHYGWTFRLGDAADLAAKMQRLADDRGLVPALGGNPPEIKPVAANAAELTSIYARILDGTWRTPPPSGAPRANTAVGHPGGSRSS